MMKTERVMRHGVHLFVALIVVLFLPYALFGKDKRTARWIAFVNGLEISLACVFLQPLFLIANPFLALFSLSPLWKRESHAIRK